MTADGVSMAVFQHRFAAITEEMEAALRRASSSPAIKEQGGVSCALFDCQARLIAQTTHSPMHLASVPASVAEALRACRVLCPGDTLILNHPYHGGIRLPDVTMVSPVFVGKEDGSRAARFFVASRAHHTDLGGMLPGSLPSRTDLYQEGLVIPPLKLLDGELDGGLDGGQRNEAVFALLTANSRVPAERMADLEAQLAAQRVGQRRFLDLVHTHGESRVQEHALALMAHARRMIEATIVSIPDGVYRFEDVMEAPASHREHLPIRVKLTLSRSRMTADFTGTAPQILGNLNATPSLARSVTWYCLRLLAPEDVPVNHGSFEPITVILPPRSLLNPDLPAAVGGSVETGQRIADVVLGALAQALPHRIPAAAQGTTNTIILSGVSDDGPFLLCETLAGGHGAGPQGDGLSGRQSHVINARNTPIEAVEQSLPVRILAYGLRPHSGGEGEHRGGDGLRRVYEFLAPATVTIHSQRRIHRPYGLQGGAPGQAGINRIVRDGVETTIGGEATVQVRPGDRLIVETPGGGGWGSGQS